MIIIITVQLSSRSRESQSTVFMQYSYEEWMVIVCAHTEFSRYLIIPKTWDLARPTSLLILHPVRVYVNLECLISFLWSSTCKYLIVQVRTFLLNQCVALITKMGNFPKNAC